MIVHYFSTLLRIFQLKPYICNNNALLCKPSVSYHVSEHGTRLTACVVCMCVYAYMRVRIYTYVCVFVLSSYCLMSVGSGQPWQMIFYHGQSLYSPKRPWSYFSIGFHVISIIIIYLYTRADEIQSYSFFTVKCFFASYIFRQWTYTCRRYI